MTGEFDEILMALGFARSATGAMVWPSRKTPLLERLHDGYAPGAADLEGVPELDGWCPAFASVGFALLLGTVTGHPVLADGRFISTSPLLATDGRSWARTRSRWYRLGDAAPGLTAGRNKMG